VTPLRIGVDARELLGAATGVGRYLGELLVRWISRPDRSGRRFLLYTPEPLAIALPSSGAELRVVPGGGGRGTWWEQVHLRQAVKRDRPDVFFAPAYTAPFLGGIPLALTVHDVSFAAQPEWFRPREGLRRRWLTRRSARAARIVFTDSEFSRSEIETRLAIDPSRITVLYPGVTPRHAGAGRPEAREPLVLYAGSIFNRRRLPDLIAAFARVAQEIPAARLVIVGEDRSWPPLALPAIAESHGVASRVELRHYVSDSELAALYGRAAVFAFLSEYEGFGLTPLEALAAGVPIVVLDTAVAREIYGEAATYVPAGDVPAAAGAIGRLLRDPAAAEPQMRHASGILGRYSWDRCAARTLAHIERVARS
jgi:glycosyltransferase involved in cell wall biosynthesis